MAWLMFLICSNSGIVRTPCTECGFEGRATNNGNGSLGIRVTGYWQKMPLSRIKGLGLISSCNSRQARMGGDGWRNSLLFFKKFPVSREFGGRLRKGEDSTASDGVEAGRSRARDTGWLQIACKCSQASMQEGLT